MLMAGGSSTQVHHLKMDGPSGSDEWGSAEFEIDGQPPPPGTDCILTVPEPRRHYKVEILAVAPSRTFNRVRLATRVKLVPHP